MKALKFPEPYSAEIVDIEDPAICTGKDVIVELKAAGICASDIMAFKGTHPYRVPPVITGHECAGIVTAIGADVKEVKIGDRVAIEPHVGCGTCHFCLHGEYQECINKGVLGVGDWNGSFGEKVLVKEAMCYIIPDEMPFPHGVLLEPYCVGLHAVRKGEINMNDTIGIIGAGTIGLMTLIAAEASGRKSSFIFDLSESKLETARSLGATYAVNSGKQDPVDAVLDIEPMGLDVVFLAVPTPKTMEQALKMTKPQGKIILIAVYGQDVPIDSFQIQQYERALIGTAMYNRDDYMMAIEQYKYKRIRFPECIISNTVELSDAYNIIREMAEGKRNDDIKNIVSYTA